MIRSVFLLCCGWLLHSMGEGDSPVCAAPPEQSRILFVTQSVGFKHGAVTRRETLAPAEVALVQLGEQTGLFRVDCTQDCAADFTHEALQKYDIIAFYSTGKLPIAEDVLKEFLDVWLKQPGHGVLGFHSAADTFHDYEPFWDMIGGTFISHPWTADTQVTLTNHEPESPLVKPFGERFTLREEIYMYRNWQPDKVRVLLSLDYAASPTRHPVNTKFGYHVPVCWIKEYGQGRVYFNNLGHNESTWTNRAYLDSITNAVKWIRREIELDAAPNPQVSRTAEEQAQADFAAGDFQSAK